MHYYERVSSLQVPAGKGYPALSCHADGLDMLASRHKRTKSQSRMRLRSELRLVSPLGSIDGGGVERALA